MLDQLVFSCFIILSCISALPGAASFPGNGLEVRDPAHVQEWTAKGDSYASGVGAGTQSPGEINICLRFVQAYPPIMQSGPEAIQPTPATFNNFACSGNTFQQIMDKELLDSPEFDSLYGTGPAWGKNPEFVTMTMGGNDIGILNLVATCIFSFKFSLGIFFDCDQVIQHGHDIIESDAFKTNLKSVI